MRSRLFVSSEQDRRIIRNVYINVYRAVWSSFIDAKTIFICDIFLGIKII